MKKVACVCVCESERHKDRERKKERDLGVEGDSIEHKRPIFTNIKLYKSNKM